MRKYEVIFIIRPDLPDEEIEKLIAHMETFATEAGGKLEKVEKMGRRRLAYHVERQREGFFVLFVLEGTGETVKELERRLKVTDTVIKFMTVRVDEELRRAAKMKGIREKRAARRPAKPAPAPPPAATIAPIEPAAPAEGVTQS
ncbi:MAG: 30S ribosomal protein S6 [Terriglobia bacterium]